MAKHKSLAPGSVASVYRPGGGVGDALGQWLVPDDGRNLHVRELAPGVYEARDSVGREVSFTVLAGEEYAVVPVKGADAEPEPNDEPNPDYDEESGTAPAPGVDEGRVPVPPLPHNQEPAEALEEEQPAGEQ